MLWCTLTESVTVDLAAFNVDKHVPMLSVGTCVLEIDAELHFPACSLWYRVLPSCDPRGLCNVRRYQRIRRYISAIAGARTVAAVLFCSDSVVFYTIRVIPPLSGPLAVYLCLWWVMVLYRAAHVRVTVIFAGRRLLLTDLNRSAAAYLSTPECISIF